MTSSSSLDLPSVAFFGRSYREYLDFFGLDPSLLACSQVLDVASGPSSFAVEAAERGIRVTAVDPLYGMTAEALRGHIHIDYRRMAVQIETHRELLSFGYFPSIESAEGSRREAARRFIEDYECGFLQGRYVGGAIPSLPFPDDSFDLVLCAHFLFLYQRMLDYEAHVQAVLELCRVCTREVRIHPTCSLDGRPYEHLDALRRDLAARAIASEVIPVDYGFFAGTGSTLILRP